MYNDCCIENSRNRDFLLCPTCSTPLLRCPISTCPGMTDIFGRCLVCLNPVLIVDAGYAIRSGQTGLVSGRIENRGFGVFHLTHIWHRFGTSEGFEEKKLRESLAPQSQFPIYLAGFEPERAGHYLLQIRLRLEFQGQGFYFCGEIPLTEVKSEEKARHIHIENVQASGQAIVDIAASDYGKKREETIEHFETWKEVQLRHNPLVEQSSYGYEDKSYLTRETVVHFPNVETKANQVFKFYKKDFIAFGRNRPEKDSQIDAMIRIYPRNPSNDQLTQTISGRHFELRLKSGKLYLRDASTHGSAVNGKVLKNGMEMALKHGDYLSPFSDFRYCDLHCWKVCFGKEDEKIDVVSLIPKI